MTRALFGLLPALLLGIAGAACEPAGPGSAGAPADGELDAAERESRRQNVRELFRVLGLAQGAGQWTQVAVANMAQFQDALDAGTIEKLQTAAADAYAPDAFLAEMTEHFVEHYDPDAVAALIEYYRSPAGAAVASASQVTAAEDGRTSFDVFLADSANEPSEERMALAVRLTEATRQSEQAIDTLLGVSRTNLRAVEPLLPGAVAPEALAAREAEVREELRERAEQQATLAALYSVRELDDEALRRHVEFVESGYYRWYVQELGPAVERALDHAGAVLSERVSNLPAPS